MGDLPDYKMHDPKGWCGDPKRGAALGRPQILKAPQEFSGRIHLRRVRLCTGGYDPNGTYFGHGSPLYWFASKDGDIDGTLRARTRDYARSIVLGFYPKARVR